MNLLNPKNPYRGVHMLGPSKFKASIKLPGSKKVTHLGYFSTAEAANDAFVTAWKAARKVA